MNSNVNYGRWTMICISVGSSFVIIALFHWRVLIMDETGVRVSMGTLYTPLSFAGDLKLLPITVFNNFFPNDQ